MEKLLLELKKLEKTAGREVKKNPLKMDAIRKLIACLRGKEKRRKAVGQYRFSA